MTIFLTLGDVMSIFKDRTYIHFTTLKPPRDQEKDAQVESFCQYLKKRHVKYWIVRCKSKKDYIHYHGIVSYSNDDLPKQMELNKAAYQSKVNRSIGFNFPLQQVESIANIYDYIHSPSNAAQLEYHSY